MINQLNYNFIKLVSKQKHTKLEESYIVTGEFIERRYLKPRINKTSTKKRFKFITLRKYNLENIFMENIEYLSAPGFILKHPYGYYKRSKVKKKRLKFKKFLWWRFYNKYNDVTQVLISKENNTVTQENLVTCILKKYRFNLYFIRLIYAHTVLNVTWESPFKFGDLFRTDQEDKYIGFCPKMLVITTKRHKPGVFWALLKQVQYSASILEGIRNLNFGSILLKKYFIQMRYVKMLLKYTYIVLKRAYLVYRSVGLQMMRFFFLRNFNLITKYEKWFLLICKSYKYTGTSTVKGKRKRISILRTRKKINIKGDLLENLCDYYKNKLKNFCLIIFNYIYKAAVSYLQIKKELLFTVDLKIEADFVAFREKKNKRKLPWFHDYLDAMVIHKKLFDNCYFFIKKKKNLDTYPYKSIRISKDTANKKRTGVLLQTEYTYKKKNNDFLVQSKEKSTKKIKDLSKQLLDKFKITNKNLVF